MTAAFEAGAANGLITRPTKLATAPGNVVEVDCQHCPEADVADRAATLQSTGKVPVLTGNGRTIGETATKGCRHETDHAPDWFVTTLAA